MYRRPTVELLAVLAVAAAVPRLHSQAAQTADHQPLTFEVASIKPNNAGPGSLQRAGVTPGDRVSFINVPLLVLIQSAYPSVSEVVGAPTWAGRVGQPNFDADRFDVSAKADARSTREQLQQMLRGLLADRFKLAVHTDVRNEPIWAIVLAHRDRTLGPNLHPAKATCAELRASWRPREPGEPDPCGTRSFVTALVTGNMSVHGFTLDQLGILANEIGRRQVVDKTGLSGAFDWDMTWTPQRFLQGPFDRDRVPEINPDGPSVSTALDEQLGLKFDSQKGDTPVLVIDHVEHPTPD